jgi:hypothetical protein
MDYCGLSWGKQTVGVMWARGGAFAARGTMAPAMTHPLARCGGPVSAKMRLQRRESCAPGRRAVGDTGREQRGAAMPEQAYSE